jgi:hypothetical protein
MMKLVSKCAANQFYCVTMMHMHAYVKTNNVPVGIEIGDQEEKQFW